MKALAVLVAIMALSGTSWAASPLDNQPPAVKEKLHQLDALRARAHDLKEQAAKAPDDRRLLRKLLEAGLDQYELVYTRRPYPKKVREYLLDLKMLMSDMYTLQKTIGELGDISGIDEKELVSRLQGKKVPFAHRRMVPLVDPWGTPYRFFVFPENGQYKIVSAGRGRKFDPHDLGIQESEITKFHDVRKNPTLDDDIVFVDGKNFTRIADYPRDAQTFLGTPCEPADELHPERMECW